MTNSDGVNQRSAKGLSPWSVIVRLRIVLWEICWRVFCSWTPKPFNGWRLTWLRLFGARIHGTPFVHQRARIQLPWHIILHDKCCVGDRANIDSLGEVEIAQGAVIAQEAYLCTGTHAFDVPGLPLVTRRIRIGKGSFIGARAFVLPGVTVGEGAIVGACSVVTGDVEAHSVNAGNPCRTLRRAANSGGPPSEGNSRYL